MITDDCSALIVSGEEETGFLPHEQENLAVEELGCFETGFQPSSTFMMLDGVITPFETEESKMFYPYREWIDDPQMIYLGSETNPRTRFQYDYWVYKPAEGQRGESISFLARHGIVDSDYGSTPLCVAWYDNTKHPDTGDYCFGMARVQQLGLYYLATGQRPLLREDV